MARPLRGFRGYGPSVLCLLLTLAFAQERADRAGRWYPARPALSHPAPADVQQLQALGYLGAYEAPTGTTGTWASGEEVPGYVLLSSGHRPEARIVDRGGHVHHRWALPFAASFPQSSPAAQGHVSANSWRAVEPLPNGGLLAVHEGLGVVALDADSSRLWSYLDGAHHEVFVDDDGSVWSLTRSVQRRGHTPVLEDHLTHRAADGRLLDTHDLLAALEASPWASWIDPAVEGVPGDWLHTNSVHRLKGPAYHPSFEAGRFLLSMRHLDALLVYDATERRMVWASRGVWARQHDAQQGPSGRLWLFDNRGAGKGHSQVLALDPAQPARVVWRWGAEEGLHSQVLGAVQELPGGHVLVTESTAGRCLEVTPDGRVVWTYTHPETVAGPKGPLMAAVFSCRWLPPDHATIQALSLPGQAPATTKPL